MDKAKVEADEKQLEALLEQAMTEAGVAEAVAIYEKTEMVYMRIAQTEQPVVYTTNSTTGTSQEQG